MANIMYARHITSKPLARSNSLSTHFSKTTDGLTVAKFLSEHSKNFPMQFTVVKGFYGPNEDLKFSEGDKFKAHSVKQSTVVNIEYDNGQRENIPADSTIPFAILYNPHNNIPEAMKGYKFDKISELVQLPVLPPVLWSRKAYKGSSSDSSVAANELLIVRKVKTRVVGKQQLKVYSLTQKKEKTLYTTCVGNFSTKPRDISLFLSDILKHMPDIFPCRAVMFDPQSKAQQHIVPVTMMHSSIDASLVISSTAMNHIFQSSGTKFLEIPIDLGIMVRAESFPEVDNSGTVFEDENNGAVYEDASLYGKFDQKDSNFNQTNKYYTNVHFGQETSKGLVCSPHGFPTHSLGPDRVFTSAKSAVEQGHYQTPKDFKTDHALSDPIPIESIYHPPDDTPPVAGGYVHFVRNSEKKGSYEGSPGSGGINSASSPSSASSSAYRPPLPPPNKIKRDHQRSPGYSYVETDPTRSTRACNEGRSIRTQAMENGDSGLVLSSSLPESANSEKSFGSTGSGGALVDRRANNGNRAQTTPGSGDGIVERMMRTSSINSAGYSYAKNTPLTSVTHHHTHHHDHSQHQQPSNLSLPTSPHRYSHLRSHSGPSILPQLPPLSSQVQRPVATTQLDTDSDSIVVVQRKGSAPLIHPKFVLRQESAPILFSNDSLTTDHPRNQSDSNSEAEALSGVIDDLNKMTLELDLLEENIFTSDEISPTTESTTQEIQDCQEEPVSSSKKPLNVQNLPPEIIEKHKTYLKSMDNFQVLRLLEMMGLEQYTPIFKQEQINGDILSTCDDSLLKDELKIVSRLHRMRLLRVIEGAYSIHEIMSGNDGYIFMLSAGKQ